jgi:outer membrane protein OmpA-like peptidoglycan-associated protein
MTNWKWLLALCLVALVGVFAVTPALVQEDAEKALGIVAPPPSDIRESQLEAQTQPELSELVKAQETDDLQAVAVAQEARIWLSRAQLEYGAYSVTASPAGVRILGEVAEKMRVSMATWEVQGHSDGVQEKPALSISERRARTARLDLIQFGVPEDQVIAKGYGDTKKVSRGQTAADQQRNRRITFRMVSQEDPAP